MKFWKLNILRIGLIFVSGIIILLSVLWLPTMANYMESIAPELSHMKYPMLIGLELTSVAFIYAVYNTFKIVKSIERDEVYRRENIKYFKNISICALYIAVSYVYGLFYIIGNRAGNPMMATFGPMIIILSIAIYLFSEILKDEVLKNIELFNAKSLS